MNKTEREDHRRQLLRGFAETDGGAGLILFGKTINPKVAVYPTPEFHYELAEAATTPKWQRRTTDGAGEDENIVREAPRGFAKTTVLGQWWPLWHAFVRPYAHGLISWQEYLHSTRRRARDYRPNAHFALISKTRTHSINNLTSIKDILDSEVFRWLFGDHGFKVTKDQGGTWTKDELVLPTTGDIFHARGTGQPIRGLNISGRRLTGFIFDDPEDENNTKTEESLLSNLDYLQKGLEPAVATPDLGGDKGVVIGTPIVDGCMVRRLADFSGWDHRKYAALYENEEGERVSLWPDMWPLDKLDKERAKFEEQNRLSVFYSEYMCEIVHDERRAFRSWAYYKGHVEYDGRYHFLVLTHIGQPSTNAVERRDTLEELPEPKILPANVFMGVDPASSVSKSADRTAMIAVAVDDDDNRYVLPYFADRVKPMDAGDRLIEEMRRYRPVSTRVEVVGFQAMLGDYVLKKIQTEAGDLGSLQGVKPVNNEKKELRLEGMSTHFDQGRVFLQPGMALLESELDGFPTGKHDDTLDALYYAMLKVYPPTHAAEAYGTAEGTTTRRKKHRETSWMTA